MVNKRTVYLLDPQEYSPETIAVTFAKTSRSPESFRQIASELNNSKSAEFNEKWVVGYGHSSVAEHAVLHIAVENISRLSVECLESNRLASYTEKSTRYQTWNTDAFYTPDELKNSALLPEYIEVCQHLLETYQAMIPNVTHHLEQENPITPDENPLKWERRLRSIAVDNCRFLLPAAVLANVGMTINARALEHALVKMLSHPLEEVRCLGEEIKSCAVLSVPTLLKYAEPNEALQLPFTPIESPKNQTTPSATSWCNLVYSQPEAENAILAAFLYRLENISYAHALSRIQQASLEEKSRLARLLLDEQNPHSTPLRELEHASFTFDVTLDQGAYYEVKRHRMMTLTAQNLTTELGYTIPRAIDAAGQTELFCEAMRKAGNLYKKIKTDFPFAASYIVPNAFNRRFLITTNLRSLWHFIRLRSAPNAHFSVRRLAQCFSDEITREFPAFAHSLPVNKLESVASIEADFFASTLKECEHD
ncbi:MAG: FAD-dependent thymidylate synthase [Anaerolineaceae bacterium]